MVDKENAFNEVNVDKKRKLATISEEEEQPKGPASTSIIHPKARRDVGCLGGPSSILDRAGQKPSIQPNLPSISGDLRGANRRKSIEKLQTDYDDLHASFEQFKGAGQQGQTTPAARPLWNAKTSVTTPSLSRPGSTSRQTPESGRQSPISGGGKAKLFEWPVLAESTEALSAAVSIFQEPEFTKQLQHGLEAQLKSTSQGATQESRMQELASLVKLLRRVLKESAKRVVTYVGTCAQQEKQLEFQAEALQLSADTARREHAVHVSQLEQTFAEAHEQQTHEKIELVTGIERLRAQVMQLTKEAEARDRELEALAQAKKSDELAASVAQDARALLEAQIKGMHEQMVEQVKRTQSSHSDAMRQLELDRLAAQQKERDYQEAIGSLELKAKESQLKLAELQQDNQRMMSSLQEKEIAAAGLSADVSLYKRELEEEKERSSQYSTKSSRLLTEVIEHQQQRANLAVALASKTAAVEALEQQLRSVLDQQQAENGNWQAKHSALQAQNSELRCQLDASREEAAQMRQELAAATEQVNALQQQVAQQQAAAQEAAEQHRQLLQQHEAAAQQVSSLQAELADAVSVSEQRLAQLTDCQQQLATAQQELAGKVARLEHLEGQFEALREVTGDGDQRDMVGRLLAKVASLQVAAAQAEGRRRELHNALVEAHGNIRVFCRVKPHASPVAQCLPDGSSLQLECDGKEHRFRFDQVFSPKTGQEEVFSSVSELVQSALDGFHVCLFSYGQTGAGKTHTMMGTPTPQGRGIIPRAIEKILQGAAKLEEQEWQYSMEAMFLEVYNNTLRDLLEVYAPGQKEPTRITDQSAVKHDPAGGHTSVVGVRKAPIKDMECAQMLMAQAAAARACQATAMNEASSRSHSVFMLHITGTHAPTGTMLRGSLCLVDLAGSERLDRSLAEDARKKEACAINASLSALGDVFGALSSKSAHVPYRNSKLTFLLQPCLGGSGKTLMFVNINPEAESAQETLCSLKFAAKVNGCETAAKGGAKRNISKLELDVPDPADAAGSRRPSTGGMAAGPTATGPTPAIASAASRRMSLAPQPSRASSTIVRPSRPSLPSTMPVKAGVKRTADSGTGPDVKRGRVT